MHSLDAFFLPVSCHSWFCSVKAQECFPLNDYLNNWLTLLLYLVLSVTENDYELISIRALEIPMNFIWNILCALMNDFTPPNANLMISLQTAGGVCEVIKVRFAMEIYGFFSHVILPCADNAIFEHLLRLAHLYWKILLSFVLFSTFSFFIFYFFFIREMNYAFFRSS